MCDRIKRLVVGDEYAPRYSFIIHHMIWLLREFVSRRVMRGYYPVIPVRELALGLIEDN